MMNFFSVDQINQFIFFSTATIGLWLAFWVYFAGKKKKVNKYFFWMVLVWIFGETSPYFLFRNISLPQKILLFLPKLEIASVFIFLIFFYFFSLFFLKEEKKFSFFNKLVPVVAIVGALLAIFTDLFQKSIEVTKEGIGLDLILTPAGKIIWLGFVIVLTLFILFRFLKNYFRASKENKLKIQYFLVGISFWIIVNLIFNVYFPLIRDTFLYAYWGNYAIIVLFIFTAYAIVKRELFGIKVVLTGLFVALIAILLALDALVFTPQLALQVLKAGILVIFLYFGYLLIKSVLQEIKRREELEGLTSQLQTAHIKLRSAYKKLKKLDEAKSEFMSIASHQLRTPLSAIKGYISMLIEGVYGALPKKAERPMSNVYKSNERLIELVNDLLSISRIEAGKIELKMKRASVEAIISSAANELKIEAKNKGLSLRWSKPSKALPKILLDKEKIRHVILNVLDNAIRYTDKGNVTIKSEVKNQKLRIIISDTGAGMTEDEIFELFQSFSRGRAGTQRWTEGVGLGLYVAKKFIDMHKGRIFAKSPGKGKGSTFYIELPIK